MFIYLAVVRPFAIPALNFVECFNEICILVEGYGLLTISDVIDDYNFKWDIGWAFIALLLVNFVVNLLGMLY